MQIDHNRMTCLTVGYHRVHSSGRVFALAKFYGSLAHCTSLLDDPRQMAQRGRRAPEPYMAGQVAAEIEAGHWTLFTELELH